VSYIIEKLKLFMSRYIIIKMFY